MEEHVRNIIREALGIEPRNRAKVYQKPYPYHFDNIPYPRSFRVPKFTKINGDDSRTTWEHIGQFLAQCGELVTRMLSNCVCFLYLYPVLHLHGLLLYWQILFIL